MSNKTFTDFAASLHEILDEARTVLTDGTDIEPVYNSLKGFIVDSDDTIDGVAELDLVARQAMRDLVVISIGHGVAEIASRSADVAALEKKFSTQSAANNSIAAGLRLEKVKAVLDASTQTVASLKALSDTLPTATDADAAKIAAQIKGVVDALTKLNTAIQTKI